MYKQIFHLAIDIGGIGDGSAVSTDTQMLYVDESRVYMSYIPY